MPLSVPEIVVPVLSVELPPTGIASAPVESAPPEKKAGGSQASTETPSKQTIRVDLDKVDRLVNIVGELVITQAMLTQRVVECGQARSSTVATGLNELEHLLRELQESVMAIRTQPVKSVFQRMPRLARELAAQTNKQVHLVLEGEATEVDKTVIERLGEPLTHMIRNAIDHGLETAEQRLARQAAGRHGDVVGRTPRRPDRDRSGGRRPRHRPRARPREGDRERAHFPFGQPFRRGNRQSDLSSGILDRERSVEYFRPGRRFGCRAPQHRRLGGRIVINSTAGKGSRFSLTLPLTLAVWME